MTCIVGLVHADGVTIGADSAGCDGAWGIVTRADTKLFHNGPFLFGFTSSFRMGQLLRYAFKPPPSSITASGDRSMSSPRKPQATIQRKRG